MDLDLETPPRARMAFRVGVVGHRLNNLPTDATKLAAIRARLSEALAAVKGAVEGFHARADARRLYADAPPVLHALSPLAEGADRMFAEEALALGYELSCPMPFPQAEYEQDFIGPEAAAGSLEAFRSLLRRAGGSLTTFELDGLRTHEAHAYAAAGRVTLNQSDLLIVVWNGRPGRMGGTRDLLGDALGFHVPILWIDAGDAAEDVDPTAGAAWMIVTDPDDLEPRTDAERAHPHWTPRTAGAERDALASVLGELVINELDLPAAKPKPTTGLDERDRALDYFAERRPAVNVCVAWKMFRDLIGSGRLSLPAWRVRDFVDQIRSQWPVSAEDVGPGQPAPSPTTAWINAALREHYAWADRRSDLYADAHRSAYVITSLLGAFAVFLALLPLAAGWNGARQPGEIASIAAEIVVVLAMIALLVIARRRRWHERWMEYRVLAELVRELGIVIPLGGGRPLPRTLAHLSIYGDPKRSWRYWQMRAIARAIGLPRAGRIDLVYIRERLDHLADIAASQIAFHKEGRLRSKRIHERLHIAALALFMITAIAVGAHFLMPWAPWLTDAERNSGIFQHRVEALGHWLVLVSAVGPALAAALASINNQSEFARLEKRSHAMENAMSDFRREFLELGEGATAGVAGVTHGRIADAAGAMARTMVDENTEWRIVVHDLAHGAS